MTPISNSVFWGIKHLRVRDVTFQVSELPTGLTSAARSAALPLACVRASPCSCSLRGSLARRTLAPGPLPLYLCVRASLSASLCLSPSLLGATASCCLCLSLPLPLYLRLLTSDFLSLCPHLCTPFCPFLIGSLSVSASLPPVSLLLFSLSLRCSPTSPPLPRFLSVGPVCPLLGLAGHRTSPVTAHNTFTAAAATELCLGLVRVTPTPRPRRHTGRG